MPGGNCDGSRSHSRWRGDLTPQGCRDPFRVCFSGPPHREPEDLLAEDRGDCDPVGVCDNRDYTTRDAGADEEVTIETGVVIKFKKFGVNWEFELCEHIDDELLEPFSVEWIEAAILSAWEEAEKLYVESRDEAA